MPALGGGLKIRGSEGSFSLGSRRMPLFPTPIGGGRGKELLQRSSGAGGVGQLAHSHKDHNPLQLDFLFLYIGFSRRPVGVVASIFCIILRRLQRPAFPLSPFFQMHKASPREPLIQNLGFLTSCPCSPANHSRPPSPPQSVTTSRRRSSPDWGYGLQPHGSQRQGARSRLCCAAPEKFSKLYVLRRRPRWSQGGPVPPEARQRGVDPPGSSLS